MGIILFFGIIYYDIISFYEYPGFSPVDVLVDITVFLVVGLLAYMIHSIFRLRYNSTSRSSFYFLVILLISSLPLYVSPAASLIRRLTFLVLSPDFFDSVILV